MSFLYSLLSSKPKRSRTEETPTPTLSQPLSSSSDGNFGVSPPPAKRRRIVGHTVYGSHTKKCELTESETLRFEIADFEGLDLDVGEAITTDTIKCHKCRWRLEIYPGGVDDDAEGDVSIFLNCSDLSSGTQVKAIFSIYISPSIDTGPVTYTFKPVGVDSSFGETAVASREEIVQDCLVDGNLIIDIHLQVYMEKESVWFPKEDLVQGLSGKQLLDSKIGTDVSFSVGEEEEKMNAHKCILIQRAPTLYEFVKNIPTGDDFRVPNITISTFKVLLHHIYTGILPEFNNVDDDIKNAKEILVAADRFDLTLLKLHIESTITSKVLKPSNAAEWLVFADSHSCPLLKEACMDTYENNLLEVKLSPGWTKLTESTDLLVKLAEHCATSTKRHCSDNWYDYDNMTVRMLRENLESKNLDLDGTREMLVQRLTDHLLAQPNVLGEAVSEVTL